MIKSKKIGAFIHVGERAFEAFRENVTGNSCGRMDNGARQRGNVLPGRWLGHRWKVASLVLVAILSFGLCGAGVGAPAAHAISPDAQTQARSLQAPVVTVLPRGDGGVSISWTESPLTSSNPDEDMRSYNLYLYDGDNSGTLKTMVVQYGLVNLDFVFSEGWFWAGKRYTVMVEAVNDARPDDPNSSARSEYISFTAPDKPTGIIGDVNNNGVLNAVDAQIAYDLASTSAYVDAPEYADLLSRADVTFDGSVDAVDAFAIQRAALLGWGA